MPHVADTIVCPYCFGEFKDTEAVFRARHGFTEDAVYQLPAEEQARRLPYIQFDEYDGSLDSVPPGMRVDESLVEFWQDRGGMAGYQTEDPDWSKPHIDPADKATFAKMTTKEPAGGLAPDPDGFVRDQDGFAYRVIDRLERVVGEPLTRLCPHCHNSLPLFDYGKYPTIFIGITGMSSAGKTVYLRQLLANMPSFMEGSGYHIGATDRPFETLSSGKNLPESTDITVMRRPQAINLIADDPDEEGSSNYTLVFYDIAGENCVDSPDDTPEQRRMKNAIASYVGHLDALLFLIDPDQIPVFGSGGGGGVESVGSLVHRVVNLRAINRHSPSWDRVPVAVVVAKCDQSAVYRRIGEIIGRQLAPVPANDKEGHTYQGFARDEFKPVNTRLHDTFKRSIASVEGELSAFKIRGYFAVSALKNGVVSRIRMHRNVYELDSRSAKAVADMKKWLQGWDVRSPQERPYFFGGIPGRQTAICPVVKTDAGGDVEFDVAQSSDAYRNVATELWATMVDTEGRGDGSEGVRLTVGDIKDLSLECVPNGTQTLRIEEPLKWLLWQLGVIREPRPILDEVPRYPLFCSKARRAEIDRMFQEQQDAYIEQFYACEDVVGV